MRPAGGSALDDVCGSTFSSVVKSPARYAGRAVRSPRFACPHYTALASVPALLAA
jgi:hypothetical protein